MKNYFAEFIGTFILLFIGTGAIIVNDISGGKVTYLGVCLVFALIILVIVYSLGDISGAHINPAVTWGFFVAGRFPGREVLPYIISQCLGGLAGSYTLKMIFSDHPTLGITLPLRTPESAFVFEMFLTAFLMFVILRFATGAKEKGLMAGVAIGAMVGCDALVGGAFTGASMNPIRSLAPAIASGHLEFQYIYIFAPLLGATLVALVDRWAHSSR